MKPKNGAMKTRMESRQENMRSVEMLLSLEVVQRPGRPSIGTWRRDVRPAWSCDARDTETDAALIYEYGGGRLPPLACKAS